jgi:hypothetical protein
MNMEHNAYTEAHTKEAAVVLRELGTNQQTGLSSRAVLVAREKYGKNGKSWRTLTALKLNSFP